MGFGQRLRRNLTNRDVCGQIRMRLVINIIRLWDLGSASGVTWIIVGVRGRIGTRLVINIICLWNLGSASGVTWRTVDVCGRIGTKLVIDCICLWDLGSASGVTWTIVDVYGQIWMRNVIDCICLWDLGSASGVTGQILDVRGRCGLDIVKQWSLCATDLRLDSSFGTSWGTFQVFASFLQCCFLRAIIAVDNPNPVQRSEEPQ